MADRRPTMGLVLHSNFARHYAAARQENAVTHGERALAHMEAAVVLQQAHWSGLEEHMDRRNLRPTEEAY